MYGNILRLLVVVYTDISVVYYQMNMHNNMSENVSTTLGGCGNTTSHTTTPRRLFLCDVPIYMKQVSSNNDDNFVRLMGTVVEIIQPKNGSSSSTSDMMCNTTQQNGISTNGVIHFVIDDGTGSIGVFTNRRARYNSNCNGGGRNSSDATVPPTNQQQTYNTSYNTSMQNQQHFQPANQSQHMALLESILSSSATLHHILVGQTVDCIGSVGMQVDNAVEGSTTQVDSGMLWLAASSVTIVNNPQATTLRLMELSSSDRKMNINNNNRSTKKTLGQGNNNPQNRILVGGHLERKLNPLYHCNTQGSVVFNMEYAFNYIKHSKDDGGITVKELASLVGAMEPNQILAVNLAVEQLREDCRIYLNQGKWFPM